VQPARYKCRAATHFSPPFSFGDNPWFCRAPFDLRLSYLQRSDFHHGFHSTSWDVGLCYPQQAGHEQAEQHVGFPISHLLIEALFAVASCISAHFLTTTTINTITTALHYTSAYSIRTFLASHLITNMKHTCILFFCILHGCQQCA
jgi:hypothetical protein